MYTAYHLDIIIIHRIIINGTLMLFLATAICQLSKKKRRPVT